MQIRLVDIQQNNKRDFEKDSDRIKIRFRKSSNLILRIQRRGIFNFRLTFSAERAKRVRGGELVTLNCKYTLDIT